VDLPKLFVACGRQDDLYPLNQLFMATAQGLGIPVDYYEEDGKHNWYFWDKQIRRFLKAILGEIPS
jgi:putative tributyrin esterase